MGRFPWEMLFTSLNVCPLYQCSEQLSKFNIVAKINSLNFSDSNSMCRRAKVQVLCGRFPPPVHTELSGLLHLPFSPDTSTYPNAISRLDSCSSRAALLSQRRKAQLSREKDKGNNGGSSPRDPTPAFGSLPPQRSVT